MVSPWWCCGLDDSQEKAAATKSITIPAIGDDGFSKAIEITAWKSVMAAGRVITSCVGQSTACSSRGWFQIQVLVGHLHCL